jgi:hypothetical protein
MGSIFIMVIGRKRNLGMVVPYLIYVVCVELRHAASSLRFLRRRDGNYALLSESWVRWTTFLGASPRQLD